MTSAIAAVLAHQGGWDEMLMVAGPILVFWLILRLARRRAEGLGAPPDQQAEDHSPEEAPVGAPRASGPPEGTGSAGVSPDE